MGDIDYHYGLLMEGKMDAMYLPAGAVAWLYAYQRPETQLDSAAQFAAMAHNLDDPIVSGALLRSDQNILVLHMQSGNRVSVYPDGGLGSNGQPILSDPDSMRAFIDLGTAPEEGEVVELPIGTSDVVVNTDSEMMDVEPDAII